MDTAHQVTDLTQRRLRLIVGIGHHLAGGLRIGVELLTSSAEVGRQRHQPLLRTVVEITLDTPPLGLGAVNRSRA